MNIKRIFGSILTILGIVALIYTAILFANNNSGKTDYKVMIQITNSNNSMAKVLCFGLLKIKDNYLKR